MSESDSRSSHFYDKRPIDPAQTEEGKARLQEYRLALGTFVEAFAQVEAAMFLRAVLARKDTTSHRESTLFGNAR